MHKFRIASALGLAVMLAAPTVFAQTSTAASTSSNTSASASTAAQLQTLLPPVLTSLSGVLTTLTDRIRTQGVQSIPNRPAVAQILGNVGSLLALFSAELSNGSTTASTGGSVASNSGSEPGFPNTGDGPAGIPGWELFAGLALLAGTGLLVYSFRAR